MKVGILTLHDSLNYGALLQAYALKLHLASCGHDAVVIDRRRNSDLSLRMRTVPSAKHRYKGLIPLDAHNGARETELRILRTKQFLHRHVGLTPYVFSDWNDAPADFDIDALVIGSDQIWNSRDHNPVDYLPIHFAKSIPCVAYAASFGISEIPMHHREDFQCGFARFAAISVREREAGELVRGFGQDPAHVIDPIALAGGAAFNLLVGDSPPSHKVFAYFLDEGFSTVDLLGGFMRQLDMRAEYFADWLCLGRATSVRQCLRNALRMRRWHAGGIDPRIDAGPIEFIRSLAGCERVVTNSYHAMVLALLFGKDVRVVLPGNPVRRRMNARLVEFAQTLADGPLLHSDMKSAFDSFEHGGHCALRAAEFSRMVEFSRSWISSALSEAVSRPCPTGGPV